MPASDGLEQDSVAAAKRRPESERLSTELLPSPTGAPSTDQRLAPDAKASHAHTLEATAIAASPPSDPQDWIKQGGYVSADDLAQLLPELTRSPTKFG
jgi:hypothetical protein